MTTITINRDVFAQHIQGLIEVMRMPNSEHVADAHNKAVRFLHAALAAQQPERKPMTDDETLALFDRVKVRMLFTDAEVAPFASGVAAAEHFHGIGDKP